MTSKPTMIRERKMIRRHLPLGLPDNARLAAAGQVLIRHGQLEHMLRMLFRTLTGLSIPDALDATGEMRTSEVRDAIRRLTKDRIPDLVVRAKVGALLTRAKRVAEKRNGLIHTAWGGEGAEEVFIRGAEHEWKPAPSSVELVQIAEDIHAVTREIVEARSDGGWLVEALAEIKPKSKS